MDQLPRQYASVTNLYLGNNFIADFVGLGQFSHLKTLSLANNCICNLSSLSELTKCRALSHMYTSGNPVSHLPNYRYSVIAALPYLTTLDGKKITNQERDSADELSIKERCYVEQLFHHEGTIEKLQLVAQRVGRGESLHDALCEAGLTDVTKEPLPQKLETPDEFTFTKFIQLVYREWVSSYNHSKTNAGAISATWSQAFETVLEQQRRTITQLVRSLPSIVGTKKAATAKQTTEKQTTPLSDLSPNLSSLLSMSVEPLTELLSKQASQSNQVTHDQIKRPLQHQSNQSSHQRSIQKQTNISKLSTSSAQITQMTPAAEKYRINQSKQLSTSQLSSSVSSLQNSPTAAAAAAATVGPASNTVDTMANAPAADAAAAANTTATSDFLDVDVSSASISISEMTREQLLDKIEQLKQNKMLFKIKNQRLKEQNSVLKDRLHLFQQQNIDNVKQAEKELGILSQETQSLRQYVTNQDSTIALLTEDKQALAYRYYNYVFHFFF